MLKISIINKNTSSNFIKNSPKQLSFKARKKSKLNCRYDHYNIFYRVEMLFLMTNLDNIFKKNHRETSLFQVKLKNKTVRAIESC
jgi:hypothetical protein